MNVFKLKSSLLGTLLLLSFGSIAQNEVEYKVLSNRAELPTMELCVYPVDVRMMQGLNAGPMINLFLHPAKRIQINANAGSMLYANPYRQDYEGSSKNGLKSMGGIQAEAIGGFVFRNKGVVNKKSDGTPAGRWITSFKSKTVLNTTYETTKYLPFDFNTLIQRTFRLGVTYDDFPLDFNTQGQVSLAIGLGKRYNSQAKLEIAETQQSQAVRRGWAIDVFYGVPFYEDETKKDGSPVGLRLVLDRHQRFTKTDDVKGFSYDYQIEFGAKPGGVAYIAMKLGFPVVKVNVTPVEDFEYKERRISKKKLGRFFQNL